MKTRKELLKEEIEAYKVLIKKAEKRRGSASVYSEIEVMNSFIKEYNEQIEMNEKEIEELTRNENIDCLSGLDKLKAIQWYLREDEGSLPLVESLKVVDIKIDEDDDTVVILEDGTKIATDVHTLFEKMLNQKKREKVHKLVDEILERLRRLEEFVDEKEIIEIRDTILKLNRGENK